MMENQQQPTHYAVPVKVFQVAIQTISKLPYDQVSELMAALQQCQPLAIPQTAEPGDTVPGLMSIEGGADKE